MSDSVIREVMYADYIPLKTRQMICTEIATLRKQLGLAVAAFKGWESLPSSVLTAAILDDTPQAQALSKARNEFFADPALAAMVERRGA